MYCLKCGRDTVDEQVFCQDCQAAMEHYPIKPGTAIHLPKRPAATPAKKTSHRKRIVSQEEQIQQLRKSLTRTRAGIAILLILLCVTAGLLAHELFASDEPLIGQNYTIDTTLGAD